MAKLMEKRDDIIVRQKRRLVANRGDEVTGQKSRRTLNAAVSQAASTDTVGHPGASTFVGTGVKIQEETSPNRTVLVQQFKVLDVLVPGAGTDRLSHRDAEKFAGDKKETLQHLRQRKIRADGLIAKGIQRLFQFFRVKSDIPGFKMLFAVFFQGKLPQ